MAKWLKSNKNPLKSGFGVVPRGGIEKALKYWLSGTIDGILTDDRRRVSLIGRSAHAMQRDGRSIWTKLDRLDSVLGLHADCLS